MFRIVRDELQTELTGEGFCILDIRGIDFKHYQLLFSDDSKYYIDSVYVDDKVIQLKRMDHSSLVSLKENPVSSKEIREMVYTKIQGSVCDLFDEYALERIRNRIEELQEFEKILKVELDFDIFRIFSSLYKYSVISNSTFELVFNLLSLYAKNFTKKLYIFESLDSFCTKQEIKKIISLLAETNSYAIFKTLNPKKYFYSEDSLLSLSFFKGSQFVSIVGTDSFSDYTRFKQDVKGSSDDENVSQNEEIIDF